MTLIHLVDIAERLEIAALTRIKIAAGIATINFFICDFKRLCVLMCTRSFCLRPGFGLRATWDNLIFAGIVPYKSSDPGMPLKKAAKASAKF